MNADASGPFRFQLSADRARDLLKGAYLHGDTSVAVLELYRNALDACRRADARCQHPVGADSAVPLVGAKGPRIRVEQGQTPDGRRFIDCTDTGAGMSVDEIAQAWSDTRGGIGVLSYFLIADSIELTTTQLCADGAPGPTLSALITGPADPFFVDNTDDGRPPGTRVRLWLSKDAHPSAVVTLRDWVLVCPYDMTAQAIGGQHHSWTANTFNTASTHCAPYSRDVIADPGGRVWWCRDEGRILVDGVLTSEHTFGAHVNMTGADAPRLTLDRRRVLDPYEDARDRLMIEAIPSALHSAPFTGRAAWLDEMFWKNTAVADAFIDALAESDGRVVHPAASIPVREVGYCYRDVESSDAWTVSRSLLWQPRKHALPVDSWPTPLPARPSDAVFIGRPANTLHNGVHSTVHAWLGDAVSVHRAEAHLGWPVPRILRRARQLGVRLTPEAERAAPGSPFVQACAMAAEIVDAPGGSAHHVVPTRSVLQLAEVHAVTLAAALAELDRRWIPVDLSARQLLIDPPRSWELHLASEHDDGLPPWRDRVTPEELVTLAALRGVSVEAAAAALTRLGVHCEPPVSTESRADAAVRRERCRMAFALLGGPADFAEACRSTGLRVVSALTLVPRERRVLLGALADPINRRLISIDFDGRAPFLDPRDVVSPAVVSRAITRFSLDKDALIARWNELGYTVDAAAARRLTGWERRLLSRDGDAHPPWLSSGDRVGAADCVRRARIVRRTVRAAVEFYTEMGFEVQDPLSALPVLRPGTTGLRRAN